MASNPDSAPSLMLIADPAILSRAVEQIADVVVICGSDERVQYVNRAFERVLGDSRDAAIGRPLRELLRSDLHSEAFFAEMEETVRGGRPWNSQVTLRSHAGTLIDVAVEIAPIRDAAGSISNYVIIERDLTSTRVVPEQMESDRLAAVGRLAAGVAHEINNPLAYVVANLRVLAELVDEAGAAVDETTRAELGAVLRDIEDGAQRIAHIVTLLNNFSSSPATDESLSTDVHECIESTLSLLDHEIRHRARLTVELGDVPAVEVSRSRLGQALFELIHNAAQAIPAGAIDSNEIRVTARCGQRDDVVVRIADTGAGIPRADLSCIFDPFYSTRPVGSGTGLGLSVAHRIITDAGGSLTVDSEVGRGTTFALSLPRATADAVSRPAAMARPGQRARILVVDDEPGVIRAITRILSLYDVTSCTTGRAALALLSERAFDLILCDLMMPDLTGMDLYEQLSDQRPDLAERVVFVTGGAFTSRAERFLRSHGGAAISKPFSPTSLRTLVAERLSLKAS